MARTVRLRAVRYLEVPPAESSVEGDAPETQEERASRPEAESES